MKFFLDTANIEEIKRYSHLIDGVTTNPTLIMRSGRNFEEVAKEIMKIIDGPVSVEVLSDDCDGMVKEAHKFSKWGKNAVIKIPMTEEGMKAVKTLSKESIKTNVTLVFSANQALLAAKCGASYVSPFVGRLDDQGEDGMQLIEDIRIVFDNYGFETEILAASIRHTMHVKEAAMIGADVATIPPGVLSKLFSHSLTDKGIKKFKEDWKNAKK